jgi:hypothetical protein
MQARLRTVSCTAAAAATSASSTTAAALTAMVARLGTPARTDVQVHGCLSLSNSTNGGIRAFERRGPAPPRRGLHAGASLARAGPTRVCCTTCRARQGVCTRVATVRDQKTDHVVMIRAELTPDGEGAAGGQQSGVHLQASGPWAKLPIEERVRHAAPLRPSALLHFTTMQAVLVITAPKIVQSERARRDPTEHPVRAALCECVCVSAGFSPRFARCSVVHAAGRFARVRRRVGAGLGGAAVRRAPPPPLTVNGGRSTGALCRWLRRRCSSCARVPRR